MTIQIDTLISARYIIPVIPENKVLEHYTVAIHEGHIIDLFPSDEIRGQSYQAIHHQILDQHILIPGLINAHNHAAMSLLRGYADDLALMDWLQNHIWPAEAKWVCDEFVFDGTQIAIAEMIKSGTTTYSDMYFFPEQSARAALQAGIRAQLAFPVLEFPTNWGQNPDEYIQKGLQLHDLYKNNDMIKIAFGPHAPYTVSNATFEKIAMLALETNSSIQIHLHETQIEVENSIKKYGIRPVERLKKLEILTPKTQCVHMATLDENDIKSIQQTGSHIVHCPESNMKLASGFCPVDKLMKAGINVALGTDSAASNNDLNLLSEMKRAALLGKMIAADPTALDGHSVLRMATINGAHALGLGDKIGSIEKNKCADLCAISIEELDTKPLYSPISSLIYTNSGDRVKYVWVNGKMLLKNGQLESLDESELKEKANYWGSKIKS